MTITDRAAIVAALMSTPIITNTGMDSTPVGGSRPLSGTEAQDVADLLQLGEVRETRPPADLDPVYLAQERGEVAVVAWTHFKTWLGEHWSRRDGDVQLLVSRQRHGFRWTVHDENETLLDGAQRYSSPERAMAAAEEGWAVYTENRVASCGVTPKED